jgi:hypothetical protein
MAFPDRLQLPLSFDPVLLRATSDALSATPWTAHFVQQNYEGDWSVIPLRCAAGETHPIRMIYSDPTATDFVDTPFLAACPYFRAVIAAFACEVRSVRLMRLTPGSVIKEHTDLDLGVERRGADPCPGDHQSRRRVPAQPLARRDEGGRGLVPALGRPARRGQSRDERPRAPGAGLGWPTIGCWASSTTPRPRPKLPRPPAPWSPCRSGSAVRA